MVEDLPAVRIKVLKQLSYAQPQSFSELRDADIASNKFAYHLRKLVEDGYLQKDDGGYELTEQGERFVSRLAEGGLEEKEQPMLVVLIVIKDEDRVLVSTRKKEPFKDYAATGPHGRIAMGEYPEDAARRVLDERVGVEPVGLQPEGLWIVNTTRDGEALYSHYHVIMSCESVKREVQDTASLANEWVSDEEAEQMNLFKDHDALLEIVDDDRFVWMEATRRQAGTEFTDLEVTRQYRF